LPGMSGFDAVKQLKAWPETRDIPVIALSAAALARDTSRAREAGFARYLTKPIKIDELTAVLEQLLPTEEAGRCPRSGPGAPRAAVRRPPARSTAPRRPRSAARRSRRAPYRRGRAAARTRPRARAGSRSR